MFCVYCAMSVINVCYFFFFFFFFNDTATTEIYTLSLHDALPISRQGSTPPGSPAAQAHATPAPRSEEHTSELQSHVNLVCRLLLEKKNKKTKHCVRLNIKTMSVCDRSGDKRM